MSNTISPSEDQAPAKRAYTKRGETAYSLSGRFALRNAAAERFEAEAERRGLFPGTLANRLLEVIARDDLFQAVLDE
jgi:hypothetical protein